MKIIFFGSSNFAMPVLESLNKKEEVVLVVTQPDRKKGRSLGLGRTPIKELAEKSGIEVFQPLKVNAPDSIEYLKKFNADLFVVVSFGQILSRELLALPKIYCLNVHASLLSKYRGAAPINWAIANGEKETGVTIMKMNEKMDEGDIIIQESVGIDGEDDAIKLTQKLSKKGVGLLVGAISLIKNNKVNFRPQDNKKATYAHKLKKEDGLIDWTASAEGIYNKIRAFVPWPGCFTYLNKKILKIWKAEPDDVLVAGVKPGTVLRADKTGILVKTGKGNLEIKELQIESKRRMSAEEFIAGHGDLKPSVILM